MMVSPAGFEPATPGLEVPAHRFSAVINHYQFLRKWLYINVFFVSSTTVFLINIVVFQS